MEWELSQLENLKTVKEAYGWNDDSPAYKARMKLIQKKGLKMLRSPTKAPGAAHASVAVHVKQEKEKAPTKFVWTSVKIIKVKDFEAAYKKMDMILIGDWKRDPSCPTSKVQGCQARRRISKTAEGACYYARVININPGSFEIQEGKVVKPQDDKNDEDDDDSSEKGNEDPAEGDEDKNAAPAADSAKAAAALSSDDPKSSRKSTARGASRPK